MKLNNFIEIIVLWALACCTPSVKVVAPAETPSMELAAIDSLMWQQPDSAFVLLQEFAASPKADSLDAFGGHYFQLLLSELLYKNDYAQTNRQELQQAVSYFDSLARQAPPLQRGAGGLKHPIPNPTYELFFLVARAHYINGVGYYERDSVVEACKEYLKALETMEGRFEEKEMVGHRARFMSYTHNRLGDMFSEQFMMESAVFCYKNSLLFTNISPISSYSVSSAMYHIGKQFAKRDDFDSANYYYSKALSYMPDTTNSLFRDMVSSQSLLCYQLTHQFEKPLERLKQMAVMAENQDEKLTRYLVIGDIYFEEKQYDSAQHYLKMVFDNKNDAIAQLQVAEFLRIIYDSIDDKEQSDQYIRFLAKHKPMEHETDAKISYLSELFKNYLEDKQKYQSDREKQEERKQATKKTIGMMIPILLGIGTVLGLLIRNKHKKSILAKEDEAIRKIQQESQRHAKAMEVERKAHQMEKSALTGRLKRSNQELRELKHQIKSRDDSISTTNQASTFAEEPVFRLIMERVNKGQFKSKVDYAYYKDYALSKEQLLDLHMAVDHHFGQLTFRLKKAFPNLTKSDLDYCCLYLVGLTDADIAALMQRAYNTVIERNVKLRKIFGSENTLSVTLRTLAENLSSI